VLSRLSILSKSNDAVNTRAVSLITQPLILEAELLFKSLDPKIAQEDFMAYVGCESFKFCIVFLSLKFCVRKENGLINPVSSLNMNVTM
jgi:hypothetical protein